MAAVHDKGAIVHASLGAFYEVVVGYTARPGGVDVGTGVENGFEVFPFGCIPIRVSAEFVAYMRRSL
jgi:hypothetical protein